ncbi:MAG: single-stranded DNA-binding protein [bacterium]|nr:single-stranded DNA-binding protein [Candidatus Jorgensenbacteria bacterium]
MNLNKVFLIGRLTNDPQLRSTPGGQSVASFSLATNRNWTTKQGEKQVEVQFHNVVAWGRQAEIISQYMKKGGMVMVEGRLQTRNWQDKQGQNRSTTEIVCESLQLGPRAAGGAQGGDFGGAPSRSSSQGPREEDYSQDAKENLPEIDIEEEIKAEDIPF